jgi:hypothetical protein
MHQLTRLDEVVSCILIVVVPKSFSLDDWSVFVRNDAIKGRLTLFPMLLQKGQLRGSMSRKQDTYLIVIRPTPHNKPSRMNRFQNEGLFASAQPVISFLCEPRVWEIWDSSAGDSTARETRGEVSSDGAS